MRWLNDAFTLWRQSWVFRYMPEIEVNALISLGLACIAKYVAARIANHIAVFLQIAALTLRAVQKPLINLSK